MLHWMWPEMSHLHIAQPAARMQRCYAAGSLVVMNFTKRRMQFGLLQGSWIALAQAQDIVNTNSTARRAATKGINEIIMVTILIIALIIKNITIIF